MRLYNYFIFILLTGFASCNQPYTIKPSGYQKIQLPAKQYQTFNLSGYPYTFDYPTYAVVEQQVSYLGKDKSKDAWLNI